MHEPLPLERILTSGILTAIIPNNAYCYHVRREEAVGLEYELVRAFADSLGVDLRVTSANSWPEMLERLDRGEGDLVAAGMPPLPGSPVPVLFSRGHLITRQQLVVRRGSPKIRGVSDLAGKTVHVARNSPYRNTLERLQRKGVDVRVVFLDGVTTEMLIRMVADGEIEATVAYDHIIRINRRYYPRAVAAGPIKDEERLSWAVPPHAIRLLARIDQFFKKIIDSGRLSQIYHRHYAPAERFEYEDARLFERRLTHRLPKFRQLFETTAETHGFDWRLIAAQVYQESHFDPQARSAADAAGLMQLTPGIVEDYEISDPVDPAQNVEAGVAYLKYLYDIFDQVVGSDRLRIALAAYNIGLGHVYDAREIARQKGLDPDRWDSLAEVLPLLALPGYYRGARHGYCRGSEPVLYVERVMFYYGILQRRELDTAACDPRNLSALNDAYFPVE
jgi:membrane-bound lytic murein transglycosylase F